MKKSLALILLAALLSQLIAACGSSSDSGTVSPQVQQMKPSVRGKH